MRDGHESTSRFATRELPKVASLPARSAQHSEWFDSGCRFNGPSGMSWKKRSFKGELASSTLDRVSPSEWGDFATETLPNGPPIDAVLCATKDGCEFGILHLFNSARIGFCQRGGKKHTRSAMRGLSNVHVSVYSVGTISENGSAAVVVPRCRRGDSESDLS